MPGDILLMIKNYTGTGFITILFVMCLSYLAVKEDDRIKRILFIYIPVIVLAFFLCPVSYLVYGRISESVTYYRLLWLVPVTPVIAYTAVKLSTSLNGIRQDICIALIAVLIAVSGRLMYSDMYMIKASNIYHMPDAVVHICDAIHVEGREVRALMPYEFQQFVRQYDSCICIPYGREYMMNIFAEPDDLRDAMIREERDPYEVGVLAHQRGCHYIVIPAHERFTTPPENYEEFMNIDGYIIYKNIYLSTNL